MIIIGKWPEQIKKWSKRTTKQKDQYKTAYKLVIKFYVAETKE